MAKHHGFIQIRGTHSNGQLHYWGTDLGQVWQVYEKGDYRLVKAAYKHVANRWGSDFDNVAPTTYYILRTKVIPASVTSSAEDELWADLVEESAPGHKWRSDVKRLIARIDELANS